MRFLKLSIIFTFLFSIKEALAESVQYNLQIIGKPIPKGLGFQPAVTRSQFQFYLNLKKYPTAML